MADAKKTKPEAETPTADAAEAPFSPEELVAAAGVVHRDRGFHGAKFDGRFVTHKNHRGQTVVTDAEAAKNHARRFRADPELARPAAPPAPAPELPEDPYTPPGATATN